MDMCTYLSFNGSCENAFKFYEKALGGKILMMMRYSDAPPDHPPMQMVKDRIMHARMQIGDRLLMASDAPAEHFTPPQGFHVQVGVSDPAEAERIYKALAAGGKQTMPMAETFWARRFGMLVDKFGIPWMINCEKTG